MVAGETILKFTDYPFGYAIVGIISVFLGFSIEANQIIILGIAGAFGTFLTVIDPMGILIRKRAEQITKQKYSSDSEKISKDELTELSYKISSIKSKAIKFEIEKIIGLFYFVIILCIFLLVVSISPSVPDELIIKNSETEPLCSQNCFKIGYALSSTVILLILAFRGTQFWIELDDKIEIVAIYNRGINSESVTRQTIESMSRAIDQNDWQIAEEWSKLLKNEITIQKGRAEQLKETAKEVFHPLYLECTHNFNAGNEMKRVGEFRYFQLDEYRKIFSGSQHLLIEDEELKKEIIILYNKIGIYNDTTDYITKICQEIMQKRLKENYGKDIVNLHYFVKTIKGSGAPNLSRLLPFGRHPLDVNDPDEDPIRERIQLDNALTHEYLEFKSDEDFEKFDDVFELMKVDAEKHPTIIDTKERYDDIMTTIIRLKKEFTLKIKDARLIL